MKQWLKVSTLIFTEELIILPVLSHVHADRDLLDEFNSRTTSAAFRAATTSLYCHLIE
jgi:hypothetical protein